VGRRPIKHTEAVGYIRSGWKARSSVLSDEQLELILEWAVDKKVEILDIYEDVHLDKYGVKSDLPGLERALDHCEATGATFVYITLGQKRKNSALNRLIGERSKNNKVFRVVAVPLSLASEIKKRVLTIRKRFLRNSKNCLRVCSPPEKPDLKSPLQEWTTIKRISPKKYKNFAHIIKCKFGIKIKEFKLNGFSDREIAEEFNKLGDVTVYGKTWTKQNIQKLRETVASDMFKEFEGEWQKQRAIEQRWLDEGKI
jgi:hypothetical protein